MLYYLAYFSTFTFSELSHFSKTFLSQVINLKSPTGISRPNPAPPFTCFPVITTQIRWFGNCRNLAANLPQLNRTCQRTFFQIQSSKIIQTAFLILHYCYLYCLLFYLEKNFTCSVTMPFLSNNYIKEINFRENQFLRRQQFQIFANQEFCNNIGGN